MPKDKRPSLPTKACAACGRSFTWRRKWHRCWDEVKYCSERCKRQRKASAKTDS
ncbi:MAG: DUF2256 domain-containing protein [Saprospirales bacterium TMED214]|nr:MAG: DUF2256 domain-containing protein [Saprospirales bacterium TMED214]